MECILPRPSQNNDGGAQELQQPRDNLAASASSNGISEIKEILDAELLWCQEKPTVWWDAQVAAFRARGTAVVEKMQNDLLGGLDGTSWHAKAKLAIIKEWHTLPKIRF